MKAEGLVKLIRQRYPLNRPNGFQSHVVLEQVPDGTGMHLGHWVDAVVFSLWESKGFTRSAFEVKVSRSDFLRELQNPLKHKWALECFHEFWFVAPQDVIQIDELPPSIGWMCPRGSKLVIKRHAVQNPNPKLDDQQLKQDREHLLEIASRFQREIVCLLNLFLIIANKSLLARDELGKYIVSAYGGDDDENVEALKEYAKNAKGLDSQKRYAQVVELILNWDKEFYARKTV